MQTFVNSSYDVVVILVYDCNYILLSLLVEVEAYKNIKTFGIMISMGEL